VLIASSMSSPNNTHKYVYKHVLFMPTMTLSVPDDLYSVIKHHNEVKWSVIARNAMWEYARKVQILDSILEKSELTEVDADEIATLVKKSIREQHDANLSGTD